MADISQTFIDALGRLEANHEVEAIAALFAQDAEIANPLVQYEDGGAEAAKTFWTQYRAAFEEISSEFRTVTEKDGVAFLEWVSKGSMDGQAFTYEGVSVLESEGDRIKAFRTYFDTRHLPTAHTKGGAGSGRVEGDTQSQQSQQQQSSGQTEGGSEEASEDKMVEAQRDAAEQRAAGGYS
jgi:limonene-1,2-epoxide hydrolase